MAKKRVNKSQAIRDYYAAHRRAKPRQVVEGLKAQGIDVNAQMVSTVRYMMRKGRGKKRQARGVTRTVARTSRSWRRGQDVVLIESLLDAKKMADQLGGIERARAALKMLEKLA